ncbi:hypothetical protein Y032_0203g1852 [Ancylostoma ceylanicum]|uniref:Arrestin C-terminal-like domain-containing protein n=1 Tax=Ancylostoma ceylanicum TaxID=53326 RepID=A0A016SM71_9BILA|nr:hypothetical protein Y032_0203g1852 [Ancylostoma ceylanicum]
MIGSSFEWTGNRNTPNLLLPHDDPQPINSVEDGVFVISAVRIQTGYYGYIRYVVRMELDRPWRFNKRNHKAFTVVPAFDLNTIPQAVLPVKEVKVKNLGIILFRHGKVTLECEISKSGFVPGEMIVVRARLINDSSKDIVKARVKLVEISSYVAYRVFRTLPPSSFINSAGLYNRQRQQRTLATGEQTRHMSHLVWASVVAPKPLMAKKCFTANPQGYSGVDRSAQEPWTRKPAGEV